MLTLTKTNRPYSLINISDNMHGKYKKKVLDKILDDLETEKHIIAKPYGKAKIYFYNQALQPQLDPDEMNKVKADLDKLKEENKEKVTRTKELKAELSRLEKVPTIEELKKQIEDMKAKQGSVKDQLEKYKNNQVKLASDADIKKVEVERDKAMMVMKKRDRMLKDVIDAVSEGMEIKPNKVREMMGLE